MNIWIIYRRLTKAKVTYPGSVMLFHVTFDKVSYLLESIMLLSQIIATIISTVKFERKNIPFTIEDILKSEFN